MSEMTLNYLENTMSDLSKKLMSIAKKHDVDITPAKSIEELVKSNAITQLLTNKVLVSTAICRAMGIYKSGFESHMYIVKLNKNLEN